MILTEMKQRRSTTPTPRMVLIVYAAAAHKPTRPPKAHPRAPVAGRHCTIRRTLDDEPDPNHGPLDRNQRPTAVENRIRELLLQRIIVQVERLFLVGLPPG